MALQRQTPFGSGSEPLHSEPSSTHGSTSVYLGRPDVGRPCRAPSAEVDRLKGLPSRGRPTSTQANRVCRQGLGMHRPSAADGYSLPRRKILPQFTPSFEGGSTTERGFARRYSLSERSTPPLDSNWDTCRVETTRTSGAGETGNSAAKVKEGRGARQNNGVRETVHLLRVNTGGSILVLVIKKKLKFLSEKRKKREKFRIAPEALDLNRFLGRVGPDGKWLSIFDTEARVNLPESADRVIPSDRGAWRSPVFRQAHASGVDMAPTAPAFWGSLASVLSSATSGVWVQRV
ncbi:hypothetical protein GGX14DRAFT_540129 [Mycena pura]|uniref:Uncharacterized protein n=1 Tax=Mycena pura TaxID=153505 RepID=A0AAD6YNY8_9AGAR|nr:hypothetical protein GGX14DRAFT_540129 [Mycena pura]